MKRLLLFLALTVFASPAAAQTMSFADAVDVLAAACGRDIDTYCKNVNLGNGRIKACLERNAAKIAPGCKTSAEQVFASVQKRAQARIDVLKICDPDMRRLCQGVQAGDRVVIYMPLIPEIVIAMQACARIGAIHSVVFGGFSAVSLKDRIEDAGAKVVITADGGHRGGHIIELKEAVDKALAAGCPSVERVIVYRRTGEPMAMNAARDIWWHDIVDGQSPVCEPEGRR